MATLIDKLLNREKKPQASPTVPDGLRVYAIGDIHGRADLLAQLFELVEADRRGRAEGHEVIVCTGDYVDRGRQSREVVELLLAGPLEDTDRILLKGNHEELMLQFLDNPETGPFWYYQGGNATLRSYGIEVAPSAIGRGGLGWPEIAHEFRRKLPGSHLRFFEELPVSHQIGDYFFCHAGVVPGKPLDQQDPAELLWIRQPFLESTVSHGKVVVHGHTPSDEPTVRANRIGIDTGAYYSDRLTCLVLEGRERRFLTTV